MLGTFNGVLYLSFILQLVQPKILECPRICVCKALDVSANCQNNELAELPNGIYSEVILRR